MIVAKSRSNTSNYTVYGNYAYDFDKYNEDSFNSDPKGQTTKKPNKSALKKRLKLMSIVILLFCTGMLIVGRYAIIMNLNNMCINTKNSLIENQKISEELRLQLIKYYDIKQIEKIATSEIKMVRPNSDSVVHIVVAEGIKKNTADKLEDKPKEIGFLGRIISFLN